MPSLLGIPTEIRLKIFEYFASFPVEPNNGVLSAEDKKHRKMMVQSRRNLRSVCWLMNMEWDPIFFSTTTVLLSRSAIETFKDDESLREHWDSQASQFQEQILSRCPLHRLGKIRRVSLDLGSYMWRCGGIILKSFQEGPSKFVNTILIQSLPRLESLDEIIVSARSTRDRGGGKPTILDAMRLPLDPFVPIEMTWREIEETFRGLGGTEIWEEAWNIKRGYYFDVLRRYDEASDTVDVLCMHGFELLFRKNAKVASNTALGS